MPDILPLALIILVVMYLMNDGFARSINRAIAFAWCAFGDTVDAIVASRKNRNP